MMNSRVLHSGFVVYLLLELIQIDTIIGCGPVQADILFLIDESGSVGSRNYPKQLDFCNTLIDSLKIGTDDVRVGAVTFSHDVQFHFALDAHVTATDLKAAVSNIGYRRGGTDIAAGINYAKDTFFTAANGDRAGVSDYILLITDGTSSGADTAGQAAIAAGFTIWVVGIGYEVEPYQQELIDIVTPQDDYFFFASSFDDLANIAPQVAAVLPCPYFCGEMAISYASPSSLNHNNDTTSNLMFFLNDSVYDISCCAVISGWEFFASSSGDVTMMVWRKEGSTYLLVGSNTVTVTSGEVGSVKNYTVPVGERIAINTGDKIGWYSSGVNIITYGECNATLNANCPQGTLTATPSGTPSPGLVFDWDAVIATNNTIQDRGYAIKAYTSNNTALTLSDISYNSSVPDHIEVGYVILSYNLTDPDVGDVITYNFSHTYFSLNESSMEITLATALPRDNSLGTSTLTLVAYDSCQNTVSTTFTISVQNLEPTLNNLPATISLPEYTPPSSKVYTLDITDASGDPVCCTLYRVSPDYGAFVLDYDNITNSYSVFTSTSAQIEYRIANSYMLTFCCEDGYIYKKSTLTITIPKPTQRTRVPRWFYYALGVSMLPISISCFAAALVLLATFLLENQ